MMNTKTNNRFISLKQWLVAPVLLLLIVILSCTKEEKMNVAEMNSGIEKSASTDGVSIRGISEEVLIIADGEIISREEFSQISPSEIKSVQVLKDSATIAAFGEEAKNGVIIISSKNDNNTDNEDISLLKYGILQSTNGDLSVTGYAEETENRTIVISATDDSDLPPSFNIKIRGQSSLNSEDPLYIIDGKKTDKSVLENLDPNTIETISVLKGENAKIYGEEGKDGVILINLK